MPRPLPLAIERLEADGIYLAYDGLALYLILGPLRSAARRNPARAAQRIARSGVRPTALHGGCRAERRVHRAGRNALAQPALLQQVLGDMPVDRFDGQRIILPQLQSELSFKTNNIISTLKRRSRHSVPPLTLVRQGGPAEVRITGMMVEDRSMHTMAYVEFLQYLSRQAYTSPSPA
jgi:hypothetical protein